MYCEDCVFRKCIYSSYDCILDKLSDYSDFFFGIFFFSVLPRLKLDLCSLFVTCSYPFLSVCSPGGGDL